VAGHKCNYDEKERVIRTFDAFLGEIVRTMDQAGDLLLVVSDHGNLENSRIKTHTRNPVPALLVGKGREKIAGFLQKNKDLTGIFPAIEVWFK
jgi:2,3-bisphosphoglycerate-independent phosphoglycerate mutase